MTVPGGATQRYSAGNKVYGGGRSNPTSGTVDPSGYVEREVNNQASDRRSGLAQTALDKLGGFQPYTQQPVGPPPLKTSPEGHYLATNVSNVPVHSPIDLSAAIQRRLQGGM